MSSDLHAASLDLLSTWQAANSDQEALRKEYVEFVRNHPDAHLRTCYPGHLTASALVLSHDHREVLLMLHAKAQMWFQMGGHLQSQDRSLPDAALREATEESGIHDLTIDPVPVHVDRHEVGFCHPKGPVDHLDVRFVAVASGQSKISASDESSDLRWFPVDALPTDEPSITDLVAAALRRLG